MQDAPHVHVYVYKIASLELCTVILILVDYLSIVNMKITLRGTLNHFYFICLKQIDIPVTKIL